MPQEIGQETVGSAELGRWLRTFADEVTDHADELTRLDSEIGDADHGSNMRRGMTAVVGKLDAAPDAAPAALLKSAGMTLVSTVGGASGPLYGTFFLRMGTSAGDRAEFDGAAFAAALRAGLEGVLTRGKAQLGDKTMVDALTPAVDALDAALADGASLKDALRAAATAAREGADATVPLVARKGRASYLGERSAGHRDPGATSTTLLLEAAAESLG
ncbi:dihydroxyacetone kinase subunit DhaL [Pseudonocardia charpentierae]|uniref:Dihydroxyacetone kinase subunit DhaL n=1 Tax=Pseudonocardia charpentierae TaxID=3075545 RepID=A0ABU2NC23_9PSEU|nr:dihydroxyacetone kinase subunit DhaL [Pseudonocardia sp. DSM 45834]MDT0350199.1 dihydroxyacetone kinase subunit DhaL [Pseudonocardia sp. DSM 45834]